MPRTGWLAIGACIAALAAGLDEQAEQVAFVIALKSVEGLLLLADVKVGEHGNGIAGLTDGGAGGEGNQHFVADAADIEAEAAGRAGAEDAAQKGDHGGGDSMDFVGLGQ